MASDNSDEHLCIDLSSAKATLEDEGSDTQKVLEVLQGIGSATISDKGRCSIVREGVVPSVIQVMLRRPSETAICEAGCFVFEGLLIDLEVQPYLRKCGINDCMSKLLELNIQDPAACLACLKIIFSQTMNDEPQVVYENKGLLKSIYIALNAHMNNFEIFDQAVLALSNLTKFARSFEAADIGLFIESVSNGLRCHYKKSSELCENALESLNALLVLSGALDMKTKAETLKTVNALLALYCKDKAGEYTNSRLSRLGASSLVYLLSK